MNQYGVSQVAQYQNDPDKIKSAIHYITQKATDAKSTIEELLFLLDMQEKVPWPDMLEKFSSLAASMSQLQGALKKSALPSGQEDFGNLLRSNVIVPQQLSMDIDPELQRLTTGRVHCWNHDVVPDYLRTKHCPEMETEEMMIDQERNSKQQDHIHKQIVAINKHVDTLLSGLQSADKMTADIIDDKPTFKVGETARLVRAVVCGEGLAMTRPSGPAPPSTSQTLPPGQQMPPRR